MMRTRTVKKANECSNDYFFQHSNNRIWSPVARGKRTHLLALFSWSYRVCVPPNRRKTRGNSPK